MRTELVTKVCFTYFFIKLVTSSWTPSFDANLSFNAQTRLLVTSVIAAHLLAQLVVNPLLVVIAIVDLLLLLMAETATPTPG